MDNSTNQQLLATAPDPNRRVRIMFVDDDAMIVHGMARALRGKADLTLCTSATEALKTLEKIVVDVLITDLCMPEVDGAALLEEVRSRYPTVLRFVLSGEAQPELMVKATRLAHQYLGKPCETPVLYQTIIDALARLRTVQNPDVARTISHLEGVPSRQATLAEFMRLLTDTSVPLDRIATSLRKDPALSARLLKVANSPYFGRSGSIESMDDAIGLLGMDMILSMAATHKLFAVTPPPAASNLSLDQLWEHCVYVSSLVRRVGYELKLPSAVLREAGTAALLHDIGKLVMAYAVPSGFAAALTRAKADRMPSWQAEYFIFGNHHAEIGGCLLNLWGLPATVVNAVSMHHTPHSSGETVVGPATLLHVADVIAHAGTNDGMATLLDFAHLKDLGLPEDLDYWLDLRPD